METSQLWPVFSLLNGPRTLVNLLCRIEKRHSNLHLKPKQDKLLDRVLNEYVVNARMRIPGVL